MGIVMMAKGDGELFDWKTNPKQMMMRLPSRRVVDMMNKKRRTAHVLLLFSPFLFNNARSPVRDTRPRGFPHGQGVVRGIASSLSLL